MAQYQYTLNRLGFTDEVVKAAGSSIGTAAVRVILDDVNAGSKQEAIRQLQVIAAKLMEDIWPPA